MYIIQINAQPDTAKRLGFVLESQFGFQLDTVSDLDEFGRRLQNIAAQRLAMTTLEEGQGNEEARQCLAEASSVSQRPAVCRP